MSQNLYPAKSNWLTIFSLRIDYEAQTFIPESRDRLITLQRSKRRCNCAQLISIHPHTDINYLHHGLMPSRMHKAHFLLTGGEKLERARQLCTTDPSQKHDSERSFRLWMLSLVVQLSELCESDHSQDRLQEQRISTLGPFKSGNVTNSNVCKDVSRILRTPLSSSEKEEHGMGYVYVLRDQIGGSTLGELKVGFSKHHPEHRAHELARCLARPEVISHTPLLPHAHRLESIVHTEL
jgi:hypothetical protein